MMNRLLHVFYTTIIVYMCFIQITSSAYSKEITPKNILTVSLNEGVWIGRFVPSKDPKTFFALGFNDKTADSPYQVYKIDNNSMNKLVDLPFNTEAINNSYQNIKEINFFTLIDELLFIGIKKLNDDVHIAIIDIRHPSKIYQSKTFKTQKESRLLLNNAGKLFLLAIDPDKSLSLHEITVNGEINQRKTRDKQNPINGNTVTAAAYQNGFFFVSLLDNSAKLNESTLVRLDVNGSVRNNIVVDGVVFEITPVSTNNILIKKSLSLSSPDSDALLYSSDLSQIKTFKIPHFYEVARFQGSTATLKDGSFLFLKRTSNNSANAIVDVSRYDSGIDPVLLTQVNQNEQQKTKVFNIMNTWVDNRFYIGTLELTQHQEKIERFFKLYEIENTDMLSN